MAAAGAMRAVLCTRNAHKVDELAVLLPTLDLAPLDAAVELPPESGDTFLDNARIKARAGHAANPDAWVLADDSGLAVDALGGAPGVHSARFAGDDANDDDNNRLLLERLDGVPDDERGAAFVCVLVAIAPDGEELHTEGRVDGTIAHAPAGATGFGYDPLFVPTGERQTFAELGPAVKHQVSHRARAAAGLASMLAARVSTPR